jgi:peptidoglycan hydrolase-like protein with peptidoglycan-binding domain
LPTLRQGWGIKPAPPHKDVRLLQQRLGIEADGRFGKQTDTAVREYQRRNGLKIDGVVGEKTWASLFAVRS